MHVDFQDRGFVAFVDPGITSHYEFEIQSDSGIWRLKVHSKWALHSNELWVGGFLYQNAHFPNPAMDRSKYKLDDRAHARQGFQDA